MTASFADNEIWHVLLAADDMKRMNVEQLDDAFRLSLVDASTMVWKAGMKSWQSLGLVAGIDDEPETIARPMAPPPPPRPMPRPAPRPPSPSRMPAPASVHTAAFHTAATPVFAAPLVAPVYLPQLRAPDPYMLPKRRVAIPSEVNFRRASGGVRWGRWLVAMLLVTGGVLGGYRQNLLREGARRFGVEGKYLYGERRVTAFVAANAPPQVKSVLTRLALLPGPNAVTATSSAVRAPEAAPVAAAFPPVPEPTSATLSEPELRTVSLDSLPVLTPEAAAPTPAGPALLPKSVVRQTQPVSKRVKASPKAEHPEPVAKTEKPKPAPTFANENPLKAAIRQAIAVDAAKR